MHQKLAVNGYFNLVTLIEDSNGKCVYKVDYRIYYPDPGFKEMTMKIAPMKSITEDIDLVPNMIGRPLQPGEYKSTVIYRIGNKEIKSDPVAFTVPKDAPKDIKELRAREKAAKKNN
jgi:hypothetical protein